MHINYACIHYGVKDYIHPCAWHLPDFYSVNNLRLLPSGIRISQSWRKIKSCQSIMLSLSLMPTNQFKECESRYPASSQISCLTPGANLLKLHLSFSNFM